MRVLLVEDDRHLAEVTRRGLSREGFVVDLAADGEAGLLSASTNEYDVIVLDINLPKLNGYDVLKAVRAHQIWTPVLMLTAKDGEYDQVDAFDLGADDYLTKPFSFVILTARLRALARRGGTERPTKLTVGDLTLDLAAHRVHRGQTEIVLTAREFELLAFLMANAGQAVTKQQILEGVWDTYYDGDPNVVEVYIGYLRKKIDAPFGTASIETLRNVGYRFRSTGG